MAGENGSAGTLRVYAVHFGRQQSEAISLLKENYPTFYELSSGLYLVKTADLSQTIAEKLRIKGEDRTVNGVVFRLNTAYSGFYSRTLWEWLDD